MQVDAALALGIRTLQATSDTAKLDAELLLIEVIKGSRAQLIAYPERLLGPAEQQIYQHLLARRSKGEPLAYLLGRKEFWSLSLRVAPAALVPRPETELLVELALQFFTRCDFPPRVADLGTGCGAIALALSHERPQWEIYATDQSTAALALAQQNAADLGIKTVQFYPGKWCAALPPLLFDAILSNPPYLSETEWTAVPPELTFEPYSALVSDEAGLADLKEIIRTAKGHLKPGGYLLLEHGSQQAEAVRKAMQAEQYNDLLTHADLSGKERVTSGRWSI